MSNRNAIIDVAKSGGNPLLNLPAGARTRRHGKLWLISFARVQIWAYVLLSNANRWIAVVNAPPRAFAWMRANLDADGKELTWDFWQANKAALASIGLEGETIDGVEYLRLPHVICGQIPLVGPE
jgi:hypothetical protein